MKKSHIPTPHVCVLGEGAWGTALATVIAHNNIPVYLWCNSQEVCNDIIHNKQNTRYLPNVMLSKAIIPTTNMQQALSESTLVVSSSPVIYLRSVLEKAQEFYNKSQTWLSVSKGIEQSSFLVPTQIMQEVLDPNIRVCALSGPSYAREVAQKQPTIVTIAAEQKENYTVLHKTLQTEYFSLCPHNNIIGIQLCGALKNIYALGMGVLSGAGFESNTKAAFFMHAFQELQHIIASLTGPDTCIQTAACLADLALTCYSTESRNNQVGALLGQGEKLETILKQTGFTPEGINTIQSLCSYTKQHEIAAPLCTTLYKVIFENKPIKSLYAPLLACSNQ